jgi:hypothetical protein
MRTALASFELTLHGSVWKEDEGRGLGWTNSQAQVGVCLSQANVKILWKHQTII